MATLTQLKIIEELNTQIAIIMDNLNPDFPPNEEVIEEVKELRLRLKYQEEL